MNKESTIAGQLVPLMQAHDMHVGGQLVGGCSLWQERRLQWHILPKGGGAPKIKPQLQHITQSQRRAETSVGVFVRIWSGCLASGTSGDELGFSLMLFSCYRARLKGVGVSMKKRLKIAFCVNVIHHVNISFNGRWCEKFKDVVEEKFVRMESKAFLPSHVNH